MSFRVVLEGLTIGLLGPILAYIFSVILFLYNLFPSFKSLPKSIQNPTTILITGANSGIGQSLAESYAKEGRTLILTGRNEDRLKVVQQICEKKGATVEIKSIDVTDKENLSNFIVSMDEKYNIDLVIANAGVSAETLGHHPAEIQNYIYTLYDINVYGVLNTIIPLIPRFKSRQQGQIGIVSSLMCYVPAGAAYASSKAAVTHLALSLRSDLSSSNVRVNLIAPSFTKTPMTDKNKVQMPLMMSADKFAALVISGLSRDDPFIAPYVPYLASYILHSIPPALSAILFTRGPKRIKKE